MQVRKVLNFEDSIPKHVDVKRALERCGIPVIDHAMSAMAGLAMIDTAIEEGKPYDLIVSDMYFPKFPGDGESRSGEYVIDELQARGIDIPVIVCSSARLVLEDVVGCIHYNPYRNDLDADMRELVDMIRNK